jgi:hypothetical protein
VLVVAYLDMFTLPLAIDILQKQCLRVRDRITAVKAMWGSFFVLEVAIKP